MEGAGEGRGGAEMEGGVAGSSSNGMRKEERDTRD
jgi:hypothetical protein